MARVILSQYIALMEMYLKQIQTQLDLLKDISDFEDFNDFPYQQGIVKAALLEEVPALLDNATVATERTSTALHSELTREGGECND